MGLVSGQWPIRLCSGQAFSPAIFVSVSSDAPKGATETEAEGYVLLADSFVALPRKVDSSSSLRDLSE